jgi:hypothetical protein
VILWVKKNPDKYPKLMYVDFTRHWLEESQDNKKLRFQGEKYFNIGKRIGTWYTSYFNKKILDEYWQQEKQVETLNKLLLTLL